MSKARAEMFKTQLDARRQIEAVLTPEQRKQWRARGPRWRDEE